MHLGTQYPSLTTPVTKIPVPLPMILPLVIAELFETPFVL